MSSSTLTPTAAAPELTSAAASTAAADAADATMSKSKRKRSKKKKKSSENALSPTTAEPPVVNASTPQVKAEAHVDNAQRTATAQPSLSGATPSAEPTAGGKCPASVLATSPTAAKVLLAGKTAPIIAKPVIRPDTQPISKPVVSPMKFLQNDQAMTFNPETLKNYMNRVDTLEAENKALKDTVRTLQTCVRTLEDRVKRLESTGGTTCTTTGKPAATPATQKSSAADDDDDIDLFGSDDDDAAPVAAPVPKAKAKAAVVAKSLIVLFVKPWDDETDLKEMERNVRTITTDGLVWGTAQLVDVAYGIKKLQIACVVEDEKVGTDFIEEEIMKFENLVQSVDIASFNKL